MPQKAKYYLLLLIIVLSVILMILLPIALMMSMTGDLSGLVTDPSTDPGKTTTSAVTTVPGTPTTVPPTTTPPTTAAPTEPPVVKVGSFTLSSVGDVLIHSNVFNAASTGNGYDFSQNFRFLADYIRSADYAAGNLETTLAGLDNGYSYSGYPNFNCPDEIIDGMKDAGFDMILTANNHSYDTRSAGFHRTMQTIADRGLAFLGTQADAEDPDYMLVERDGITLGLMCYTYEDNADPDVKAPNGIPLNKADTPLMNTFNYQCLPEFYEEIEETMAEMESLGAEATVLYIHWGYEYHLEQNSTQSKMAQALCDLGIDVIIGGHPHVVQPVELLTSTIDENHKTVCLYSMGNAVSNQRQGLISSIDTAHTEDGVLFSVTFSKYSDGTVILESADLLPTWVFLGTSPVTGEWEYNIMPLDDSVSDWYAQLQLTDSMYKNCKASYDRTMAIVGSGMAEVDAYLAQNVADTEALLGVTAP